MSGQPPAPTTAAADGHIRMDGIRTFIDWAVRKGYCPRNVPAEQVVDRRFLDGAGLG